MIIHFRILKLHENGIIQFSERRYIHRRYPCSLMLASRKNKRQVRLMDVIGDFYLFFMGTALSLIVFISRLAMHSAETRRNKRITAVVVSAT